MNDTFIFAFGIIVTLICLAPYAFLLVYENRNNNGKDE